VGSLSPSFGWDSHFWLSFNAHPRQSDDGPMTRKADFESQMGMAPCRLRTSISAGPKWSIIPAPASAARLRGRSV
jgi:hypothetical protein